MSTLPIRVLCADDHQFLIDGLKARFELESDINLVGSLNSTTDLLAKVQELKPNIVLLDIEMPGPDPFDTAHEIHRTLPNVRVIILSAHIRDHYINEAVKSGAFGYFSKSGSTDEIINGIRRVARNGEFVLGSKVKARCTIRKRTRQGTITVLKTKLDTLSPREQEVLRMIGRGMTRIEIAEMLCRSPKTVDGHREKIMDKLDIHDRGELVRYAIREGLAEA
jgi:DNA-binding NarL/FixJ family response regulator